MRSIAALAVLLLGAFAGPPRKAADRYLYVVSCDARVDRIDTVTQQKTPSRNLTQVPSVKGALDGCLAYQAIYDEAASIFYTLAPVQPQPKPDGTKDYRILGFAVPSLKLVKNVSAGENLDEPPHLELASVGVPTVVKPSDWTPQTQLDLSSFLTDGKPLPHQILESSVDIVLLRIFTADRDQLQFAVANRKEKTLVRLLDVSSTVAPSVHLTPGGDYVLVEHTDRSLTLYDARTGRTAKQLSAPMIKDLHFLAISPSGKAVYHSNQTYRFIDLGKSFPAQAVTRPLSTGYPSLFFADK